MSERPKKILLIDANSIMNRAYYALAGRNPFTAPDGTPTGAVHAFLNILNKYLNLLEPTHVCALFDTKAKTFRHEVYDAYKAKRKKMPDELSAQFPVIKDILDALRLARIEVDGYEADDLIGTLSKLAFDHKMHVAILSGDKDDFQLINDQIIVYLPVTSRATSTTEIYDRTAFIERYGFEPERFLVYKALVGDPSDNIPGVKGIGKKTATELVVVYDSLDAMYENIQKLPDAIQKKLQVDRDMAYLSYDLSQIRTNAPIEKKLDEMKRDVPNEPLLAEIFMRLGMRSQLNKWTPEHVDLKRQAIKEEQTFTVDHIMASHYEKAADQIKKLLHDHMSQVCLQFFKKDDASAYIMLHITPDRFFLFEQALADRVFSLLSASDWGKHDLDRLPLVFDIKDQSKCLLKPVALSRCFDLKIAAYILNQIDGAYAPFDLIYERATGQLYPASADATKTDKDKQLTLFPSDEKQANNLEKLSQDIARTLSYMPIIASVQKKMIASQKIESLIYDIEMPLILCLDKMERRGVRVDSAVLDELHETFNNKLNELEKKIYVLVGEKFNILSPKQLGSIIFDKLGLSSGKKTGGGQYSTDNQELIRLQNQHPVIPDIMMYRQLSKLDSTFVLGLKKVISNKDGRVHTHYSQVLTQTGRLSSFEPNLQNIPIRTEFGSQIRKAFVADDGMVFLDADYSQIELRLLAHLSADDVMRQAFIDHEDIHINTAMRIFNVTSDAVEPYMRAAAKTVNFSIVYGISDFGLAQDLGIPVHEAHRYITQYYEQYPDIKRYLEGLKREAYEKGYVSTQFGRRRVVHELLSQNRNIRQFGERVAMNSPLQGTAADIIKIAMNRVEKRLKSSGLNAKLILQVHDELIVECEKKDADAASVILREEMENSCQLSVPLVADVHRGQNWFDCKV